MTETISVQKGLIELKLIEKRIYKATSDISTATVMQQGRLISEAMTEDKFVASAKASFDSVTDLIAQRNKIKSAIILSNAKTKVKIGGKEYTVAEAIDRKDAIDLERDLVFRLKTGLTKAEAQVIKLNSEIDARIDRDINSAVSGSSKSDDTSADVQEALIKTMKELHESKRPSLIDALAVKDKVSTRSVIDDKEAEIDTFLANVDFALTESNVITKIEV